MVDVCASDGAGDRARRRAEAGDGRWPGTNAACAPASARVRPTKSSASTARFYAVYAVVVYIREDTPKLLGALVWLTVPPLSLRRL
jgi:hypothetical protein